MGLCVTISLWPVKAAFKVMSDCIRTQCHITTPKPPNCWEAQLISTRWDPTLLLRLRLLDGLCVATQSWVRYIWFGIQWMPLLWFLCHLLNEFPAFGMMPTGVWFNRMEMEENNIYNSVVICALKHKHSISVLKCTLMYIQKRCNIHK